jgi:hypothetical protein
MAGKLEAAAFVELRGRPWLVEETVKGDGDFESLRLSCIVDDAQSEQLEIMWDAEIGQRSSASKIGSALVWANVPGPEGGLTNDAADRPVRADQRAFYLLQF